MEHQMFRQEPPTELEAPGYDAIDDPVELRVAIRELRRVGAWIGQFADVAAEMPGLEPESARAAKATAMAVSLLVQRARARLEVLTGQAVAEIVPEQRRRTVPAWGLSSTTLALCPGEVSTPRAYPDDDAVIIVLAGVADLYWWNGDGAVQRARYRPHQPAYVRHGTPHCAVNAGVVRMAAVQVRGTANAMSGMTLLPDLLAALPNCSPDGAGIVAAG